MLTVMCPNCRHRFPAPGCCGGGIGNSGPVTTTTLTNVNFQPVLLGDGCQQQQQQQQQQVTISTQYGIQSGGCLIQSTNAEVVVNTIDINKLELRSRLSGGGCLVQKMNNGELDQQQEGGRRPVDEEQRRKSSEQAEMFQRGHSTTARLETPPSGCQELPGTRREPTVAPTNPETTTAPTNASSCDCRCSCACRGCSSYCRNSKTSNCTSNSVASNEVAAAAAATDCRRSQVAANNASHHLTRCCKSEEEKAPENIFCNKKAKSSNYAGDVQIQVNATVRLPSTLVTSSTLGSCTLNITATTSTTSTSSTAPIPNAVNRIRNNFNGGGIVSVEASVSNNSSSISNHRDEPPSTPVSWLAACPWPACDPTHSFEKDAARLVEVRKLLQTCGWYHEGLSWQQSESLLKDAPLGKWLMRDSSDSKYTFAISVQTARGPTSIRVFFSNLRFRLDAEPRLAETMPKFDCPIKMVEHYCEYSTRDGNRQEVWVDYSGQVYSQIYLAEPLVKEVRPLTHLARVAVNRNKQLFEEELEELPPLFKYYLDEYPYTL